MAAPRAPPALRFGPELVRRLDQALGRVFEPIEPVSPPETVGSRLAFPEPLLLPEALVGIIGRLTDAVCAELERRGQGPDPRETNTRRHPTTPNSSAGSLGNTSLRVPARNFR